MGSAAHLNDNHHRPGSRVFDDRELLKLTSRDVLSELFLGDTGVRVVLEVASLVQ